MRWKFVIPVGLIIVAVVAGTFFFLDSILKHALISSGEGVFGAKVEVASVKTRMRDLSISISGLTIADKSDVWKNLFAFERVQFSMKPLPLLSKKLIINEMSVTGISWGTRRDVSGALPPKKIAALEKNAAKENKNSISYKLFNAIKEKGSKEVSGLPSVAAITSAQGMLKNFSPEKLISAADLSSIKEMDTLQKGVQDKYAQYQTSIGAINVDQKSAALRAAIDDVSKIKVNSVEDIAAAKAKLAQLKQVKEDTEKTVSDIATMKTRLTADFGDQKDMIVKINALKDSDWRSVSSKLKLPSLSVGNVSQSLFGPLWVNRVQSAMYYMHLVQKYMPPRKKDDTKIVRKRQRGTDVSFPTAYNPPDFLIAMMAMNGTTGGTGKQGEPLAFTGTVTDITSDPVLLGRPLVAKLHGTQAGKKLALEALFNHCIAVPQDTITVNYAGMNPADLGIPSSEYLPPFESGTAEVNARFMLQNDTIDCTMDLTISQFSLVRSSTAVDELHATLAKLWDGIPKIQVTAKTSGTMDNLSMSVSSNIDKLLSDRLQKLFGDKMAEAQSRVRAEIDKLTEQKKQELLGQFSAKRDELLGQLTGKQNGLQAQVDAAKSQASSRENEMKDRVNQEKNKAAEDLKKQAGDAVKNLFKM
ncbi:MAG: TIGR03545 family protein [Elusimicrobia bacterium]|nr:TIGR03545 family protein [Elusimicrobiota bacterium]